MKNENLAAAAEWSAMTDDEQEHAWRVCGYNPTREWGEDTNYGPAPESDPNAEGM